MYNLRTRTSHKNWTISFNEILGYQLMVRWRTWKFSLTDDKSKKKHPLALGVPNLFAHSKQSIQLVIPVLEMFLTKKWFRLEQVHSYRLHQLVESKLQPPSLSSNWFQLAWHELVLFSWGPLNDPSGCFMDSLASLWDFETFYDTKFVGRFFKVLQGLSSASLVSFLN